MENHADPLLTPHEAAELLRLPTHRIRTMIHRRQLPAFKVGSQWRIPRNELTKFVQRPESWLTFTLLDGKCDIEFCAKPLTGKDYRLRVRVPDELIGELAAAADSAITASQPGTSSNSR